MSAIATRREFTSVRAIKEIGRGQNRFTFRLAQGHMSFGSLIIIEIDYLRKICAGEPPRGRAMAERAK